MKMLGGIVLTVLFLWGGTARGDRVYITGDGGTNLYVINSSDGSSTLVGSFGVGGVLTDAFASNGQLYAIVKGGSVNSQLATVNLSTGAATTIGSPTGIAGLVAMEFAPNGTLYAASLGTNDLYSINLTTGAATEIGSLGFTEVMDLAWDPFNATMYAIASSGAAGTDSFVYSINLATGAGTLVSTITGDDCLMGLAVDSEGQFLSTDFCVANSPLYAIDLATGNLTNLGDTGIGKSMGGATATPEPATLLLMGTGLMGLGFLGRKKLQNQAVS